MGRESKQKWLERNRKPRVHITYSVYTGGAEVVKELPFVVGVTGDFSGNNPSQPLQPLRDRKFIQIDRDNFDQILARMAPGLSMRVQNVLNDDNSEFGVQLKFNSMADFEPGKIVQQVPMLRELLEARNKLRDLITRVDRSDDLEAQLARILKSTDELTAVKQQLGAGGGDGAPAPEGGK